MGQLNFFRYLRPKKLNWGSMLKGMEWHSLWIKLIHFRPITWLNLTNSTSHCLAGNGISWTSLPARQLVGYADSIWKLLILIMLRFALAKSSVCLGSLELYRQPPRGPPLPPCCSKCVGKACHAHFPVKPSEIEPGWSTAGKTGCMLPFNRNHWIITYTCFCVIRSILLCW